MQPTRTTLSFFALLIFSLPISAREPKINMKKYSGGAVEIFLRNEGVDTSKIKQFLPDGYNGAIEDISAVLTHLLERATSVIFSQDLYKKIKVAVAEKLKNCDVLPSFMLHEFDQRCRNIIKELKESMWVTNVHYVSKEEIDEVVDSQINQSFIAQVRAEARSLNPKGVLLQIEDAYKTVFKQDTGQN